MHNTTWKLNTLFIQLKRCSKLFKRVYEFLVCKRLHESLHNIQEKCKTMGFKV